MGVKSARSPTQSSVTAVCFDLDDTLYDYHAYARAGLRAAADRLAELTGEDYADELERLYFEESITSGTFDRLLDDHDLSPELLSECVEAYHDADTALSPYPETVSVLADLAEDYRLGVVTDGRGGHRKLHRLGLADTFESVVVAPAIDATKCDARPFEVALMDLAVPPDRVVFVGDDPRVDVPVPNELGMTTVRLRRGRFEDLAVPGDTAPPDYEIDSLDRLPAVL
ncbi:HAD family hydrolase [Halococcoides cellulosivorans]|uniref:HAD family hydrolase n=1 Tax=Halococcoides cellulosivorans TaxID=1679096 RepID=A0A2R4X3H6_9EURY|nr:HAD family hydrolase [Halococcoides cellulosivorans]AWB28347.1 hypothetical protein HARCEL1_11835 [Halococcoides cellulosivorans]